MEYEKIREQCISKYKKLYKDSLVFDLVKVDKPTRVRLLNDPIYVAETKSIKASLFEEQIDELDKVLSGVYGDEGKESSTVIMKALEMKQKLLLNDIGINDDLQNALNITFTAMSRKDFDKMAVDDEKVEINFGTGNADVAGALSLGQGSDDESAEQKAKRMLKQKQMEEKGKDTSQKSQGKRELKWL